MKFLAALLLSGLANGAVFVQEPNGVGPAPAGAEARIAAKRAGTMPVEFIPISKLSGGDLARFFPERAYRLRLSGSATISCIATAKGSVSRCKVVSETPEGSGFGAATVLVAQLVKLAPRDADGDPIDGFPFSMSLKWAAPS